MGKLASSAISQHDLGLIAAREILHLQSMLSEHADEWFSVPLCEFMKSLCRMQHMERVEPVACISLSFLNTSIACGEPSYRIDAYGEDWMLYNTPLLTQYVGCPWFSPLWDGLLQGFHTVLEKQEIRKYCSPLQAEQAAWKCVGPLLSMMGSFLKYLLDDLRLTTEYRQLVKGDFFRLEFGEYWDWKVILLAQYPEVDIFNTRGSQFPHRYFHNMLFEKKKFTAMNLLGCRFEGCVFSNCHFTDAVLNDCVFINCKINDSIFETCLMAGAQFIGSTFSHVQFSRVVAETSGIPAEQRNGWYRPLRMEHTSINYAGFHNCYLNECILEQCTTSFVTVSECMAEYSDFAALIG